MAAKGSFAGIGWASVSRPWTHLLIGALLIGAAAAQPAAAQLPAAQVTCRSRAAKGVRLLARTLMRQEAKCHRLRMQGALPPAVDCNDRAQLPALQPVLNAEAKLALLVFQGCAGRVPADDGHLACPSPCGEIAIDADYSSVTACLACVTRAASSAAVTAAYGSPPAPADGPSRSCQNAIGRALRNFSSTRMREQQKCQLDEDREPAGADCRSADPHGRIARARERADAVIATCAAATLGDLDSCATDVGGEQACIEGAAVAGTDALFDAVYDPVQPADTPTPTATPTPSPQVATPEPTATPEPSSTPTATLAAPVFSLGMTVYRPQTESYGGPFQRRAVPDAAEEVPGAGIRVNGDDDNGNGIADRDDGSVGGENDLIELALSVSPGSAPPGYEYVLRRSSDNLRVWASAAKTGAVLDANDEQVLAFSGGALTLWVENPNGGAGQLELLARTSGGTVLAGEAVGFYPFTSVVIALGGESQVPSDPPSSNHGIFNVALSLYAAGYDVHMYDEDDVGSNGAGAAYDEVVRAVQGRGIGIVSIFGYSHGGGSTHDLAEVLDQNRASIGTFSMPYSAYIDAIENDSDFDLDAERRLPPATAYHVNYYQRSDFFIRGNSVAGADVDVNANDTPWGGGLDHGAVDDHANVRSGVLDPLLVRVPR